MSEYKYKIGDQFLIKDFIVKAETLKPKGFIQSKKYEREIGTIIARSIHKDDGCEYYNVEMEDGFTLTVGKYFLDDSKRFCSC